MSFSVQLFIAVCDLSQPAWVYEWFPCFLVSEGVACERRECRSVFVCFLCSFNSRSPLSSLFLVFLFLHCSCLPWVRSYIIAGGGAREGVVGEYMRTHRCTRVSIILDCRGIGGCMGISFPSFVFRSDTFFLTLLFSCLFVLILSELERIHIYTDTLIDILPCAVSHHATVCLCILLACCLTLITGDYVCVMPFSHTHTHIHTVSISTVPCNQLYTPHTFCRYILSRSFRSSRTRKYRDGARPVQSESSTWKKIRSATLILPWCIDQSLPCMYTVRTYHGTAQCVLYVLCCVPCSCM